MPIRRPDIAGRKLNFPMPLSVDRSIAGISRDQTDAAIITPEENPSKAFCKRGWILSFIKNTIAAPRVVPTNGMETPAIVLKSNIEPPCTF